MDAARRGPKLKNPELGKLERCVLYLPEGVIAKLDRLCGSKGCSRGELLMPAIVAAVEPGVSPKAPVAHEPPAGIPNTVDAAFAEVLQRQGTVEYAKRCRHFHQYRGADRVLRCRDCGGEL